MANLIFISWRFGSSNNQPDLRLMVILLANLALTTAASAQQPVIPPGAIKQLQQVVGNRSEAAIILGGDDGATTGIYSFRGGDVAKLAISKVGGGGAIAEAKTLGIGDLSWAPVLQGNLGYFTVNNDFPKGYLQGNRMEYDVWAVQGGGGTRVYFNEHLSLAPTICGIYANMKNRFTAHNPNGDLVKTNASGTIVDWTVDTWTIQPALDLSYKWRWSRATFEFSSSYNFFHTESFHSTSSFVSVNGDSQTWENKLDVDLPLGLKFFGRELHTGGFVARTEMFGGISDGLNEDHLYTLNGRLVVDLLGKVWAVRWLGLGYSYFVGDHVNGWSAGLDFRFQF